MKRVIAVYDLDPFFMQIVLQKWQIRRKKSHLRLLRLRLWSG